MNALLELYNDKPVVILAFPCDQFNLQQPEADDEILNGIKYVRPGHGFVPNNRIHYFAKSNVNGADETSLYKNLKSSCPATTNMLGVRTEFYWDQIRSNDITWNWNKFLLDKTGVPRHRFGSDSDVTQLTSWIDNVMNEK
ncbi:unnamed protein product [Clavelina lepadiformis]|uniref:Glutathione peroxidase n=1 Tax=Clavelina lepadiformis TaxID=159417 RepID=A0ABP0H4F2_CLALP